MNLTIDTSNFPSRTNIGRKGDLEVSAVNHTVNPDHGEEACMLLRHMNRGTEVLVPLHTAWRWNEPQFMVQLATAAAKKLYPFMTRDDVFRVLDAVLDFMDDLVRHPPSPQVARTLGHFLEDCDRDGLQFFVEVNGDRKVLT